MKRKHWWLVVNKKTGEDTGMVALTRRDAIWHRNGHAYPQNWKVIKVVEEKGNE